MDTSKAFNPYEVIGVITPGAVVALLLALEWPDLRTLMGDDGLSLGDFGLFVVMAFVLGHLVQILGQVIEEVMGATIGLPTSRVRSPSQTMITTGQREALIAKIDAMEGRSIDPMKTTRRQWRSMIMRGYAKVRTAGRAERVDAFYRTYSLFRGLSAAFIAAFSWYGFIHPELHQQLVVLGVLTIGSLWRMHRASVTYACGLIHEFIDL